jgi:hypothetical protein
MVCTYMHILVSEVRNYRFRGVLVYESIHLTSWTRVRGVCCSESRLCPQTDIIYLETRIMMRSSTKRTRPGVD